MEGLQNLILVLCYFCKIATSQINTFSNPILDSTIRGASILKVDGFYYMVHTDNGNNDLEILKSPFLTDFRWAEKEVIYKLPTGFDSLFPSAFLEYENDLYLYFHMSYQAVNHMYVIKADNPKNPFGNWSTHIPVLDQVWNETAIHGAPFELNNELYLVWTSPIQEETEWNFYIANLESPTKAVGPVVLLREPTEIWECHGTCTVHAPSFVSNRNNLYMVFSASLSSVPETAISYMSIQNDLDPMNTSNWKSVSGPVFQGRADENVYSTRFPEFTTSPDGLETWMMYIASSNASDINPSSRARIEKIYWNETDGSPIFPVAKSDEYQQELPSGEPAKFYNPVEGNFGVTHYPNAYRVGNVYYTVTISSSRTQLVMLKSDELYNYTNAETSVVYTAPDGLFVYAGRLFEINGEIFLYFTGYTSNGVYSNYVLKAEDMSNLMENWGAPTSILVGVQGYHTAVLKHNNQIYFVYSIAPSSRGVIYIAAMSSPTEVIESSRILLKEPSQAWECHSYCYNEYPTFVYHKNVSFLVFGTSLYTAVNASLSYMSIEAGKDPMNVTNWYVAPGLVFTRNDEENVYATGRAWFTTSSDGEEDWMMYQGSDRTSDVAGSRRIRIQKIGWDEETGHPVFPKAHGYTYPLAIPSS